MAFVINRTPTSFVVLRYVEQKLDGSFQYRRRIPGDVQLAYGGKAFFVRSLRRDMKLVPALAARLTECLDKEWIQIRTNERSETELFCPSTIDTLACPEPSSSVEPIERVSASQSAAPEFLSGCVLCLTEALNLYLKFHPKGSNKKFAEDNTRAIGTVSRILGDLPLNAYTRLQAEHYRDTLLRQQSSGTVRRRLRMVCAIFNRAKAEKQLGVINPFQNLGIAGEGNDEEKRVPFDTRELRIIAGACRNLNDDIRQIIAMQLDTGCRVAELVGLRVEDVMLDHAHPHVRIRPWGKVRTLKTAASERDIPLIGEALWAAQRAVEAHRNVTDKDPWLFPRYASDKEVKATHASATLNKWLRSLDGVGSDKTTHCFRHAMRDRLRAAEVPHDIQEAIGGWGSRTIGQGYGRGYPLNVLATNMQKILLAVDG